MVVQSRPLPILITRPQMQAQRFAAQINDICGDAVMPVISPLLAPVFLHPALPQGAFGGILLSSETGAQAAADLRQNGATLPDMALCVGDQTAHVAQGLGFRGQSAAGDVNDLLALVLRHRHNAPFLHLRGRETTGDLVASIRAAGIGAEAAIVYAQDAQPLMAAALTLLSGQMPVCVPLFSPRSARLLATAVQGQTIRAPLWIVAISAAAADAFAHEMVQTVRVAARPDGPAMLRAVAGLCVKP